MGWVGGFRLPASHSRGKLKGRSSLLGTLANARLPLPAWTAVGRMLQPRGRDPQAIAGAPQADWAQP
jgi:hypothetical protein